MISTSTGQLNIDALPGIGHPGEARRREELWCLRADQHQHPELVRVVDQVRAHPETGGWCVEGVVEALAGVPVGQSR